MLSYITSFNMEMYKATGCRLLQSFESTKSDGRLLTISEETNLFTTFCLENSQTLKKLRKDNLDIIPKEFGGFQEPCKCNKDPINKSKDRYHKRGCPFTYWNRRVFGWMKKVVSLEFILQLECPYVIWLDSDCMFLQKVPEEYIINYLENYDIFYFKGPKRAVDETGIVGYNLRRNGKQLIKTLLERYVSGKFREDTRWDDGFQFNIVRKRLGIRGFDLAAQCQTTDPIPETELGKYICHYKGTHGRMQLI